MTTAADVRLTATVAAPHLNDATRRTTTPRLVPAPALARRQQWQRRYRLRLQLTDLVLVIGVVGLAAWVQITLFARADFAELKHSPWDYLRVFVLTCVIWLISLALFQTRTTGVIGHGTTEYRRVVHATGMAFGILAIGFVVLQSQGIRMQLLVGLPLGIPALVLGRWLSRRWLVRQQQIGEYVARAVVVGKRRDVEYVVNAVHRTSLTGYRVVGVVLDGDDAAAIETGGRSLRSLGTLDTIASAAAQCGADAVIVASTREGDADFLKHLAWQLEGTAAELVLSSPLVDVAGPRMSLKPIEGLPLVQVEIPTFEGGRYALKRTMDIAISFIALVGIALITPIIALAITLDSKGPVFFRQERVGRDGRTFRMVKFRSMGIDAEAQKAALAAQNEGAGPLFKLKTDPRVTRVGAVLRKYSIDELPQFWNVFVGDMSAVGPRPPLPEEVTAYDGTVYRRLYIKPGITGLWQVSGRSDLSWDESVRLDLRYVENWSVTGDVTIMWRTLAVMLKPEGAY